MYTDRLSSTRDPEIKTNSLTLRASPRSQVY